MVSAMQLMAAGEADDQACATHPNRIPNCAGGLPALEREQKTERHRDARDGTLLRRITTARADIRALDAGRRFTEAANAQLTRAQRAINRAFVCCNVR